jgi:Trk K+ transport system NAD-binding subunit
MQVIITVTDLLGMTILVGALPVFVGPLLENVMSTAPADAVDPDLQDHVVICSDTSRAHELIEELVSNEIPYVLVESDRDRAIESLDNGYNVVQADPQSTAGLKSARLASARALFADMTDEIDASIVLAANGVAEDVPVISVVEDPETRTYHRLAGADHVLSPRALLGERLATKVTTASRTDMTDAVTVEENLELAEVPIRQDSPLAGTNLRNSRIRERTGVSVIGIWVRGTFIPSPAPDTELASGSVLLVSGQMAHIEEFLKITQSPVREFQAGSTIVIGYGQVGQAVCRKLDAVDLDYTVIDETDGEGVDIVGDATNSETLSAAGVENAETVVLALPDDTTTEFATLVIRDMSPDTEVLARIESKSNTSKTYRAGADYVLSLATVTARMAASHLMDDREVLAVDEEIDILRESVPNLAGQRIGKANIREQTGCTIIAIEREGQVITDIGPRTRIKPDDELVIVGTDAGIQKFEQTFDPDVEFEN